MFGYLFYADVYATSKPKKKSVWKGKAHFYFFIETCHQLLYTSQESIHLCRMAIEIFHLFNIRLAQCKCKMQSRSSQEENDFWSNNFNPLWTRQIFGHIHFSKDDWQKVKGPCSCSGWLGVSESCGAEGEGSLSLDHVKDICMDPKLQKHSQSKLSFQFRDDGLWFIFKIMYLWKIKSHKDPIISMEV